MIPTRFACHFTVFGIANLLAFGGSSTFAASPSFSDQTATAGISAVHAIPPGAPYPPMVGGGAVGDFNNDGWQDLFILAGGMEADRLYINNQDGTFTDQAAAWGVDVIHQGAGASAGDYDGNGFLDIYTTSYCPVGMPPGPGYHRLYKNNGNGTFTEVAVQAGVNLAAPIADGFGSAFGDYDLDGDLDLAMSGWSNNVGGNRLFRNNGDGTFTNATSSLNYDVTLMQGFSPRFTDMDRDRFPELLFVSDHVTSRYFVNQRNGEFVDRTESSGTGIDLSGMGTTTGDFNGDGRIDWFVTAVFYGSNTTTRGNMLYMQIPPTEVDRRPHRYVELSEQSNTSDGAWGWGTVAVDFNHDGFLDIGETNGWSPAPWTNQMNRLYMNNGDETFTDMAAASGFTFTGQGRGLANFDYDNDGDQDVVVFPNQEAIRLYRNDLSGSDSNWLRLFFDTTADLDLAPNGLGTRVVVTADNVQQVRYLDGGSNFLATSEFSAHFGMGSSLTADIRVEWSDGTITGLQGVATNQTLTIASGTSGPSSIPSRGIKGDLNGDGLVSGSDVQPLVGCITGPEDHIYSGCRPADWDDDEDVDLEDFASMQQAIGGSP